MSMEKGVIFDMDGVISQTQHLHARAEQEALREAGVELSQDEISSRFSGVYDKTWFLQVFDEHDIDADVEAAIAHKWQLMEQHIDEHGVRPVAGVMELIRGLAAEDYPLGVASASPTHFIRHVMEQLGLTQIMRSVHSAEDVEHGKPEPDLFLLVADELGTSPEATLVIEDGRSGMIAAKKAGMQCIGLVSDMDEDYPPVDLRVTSLEDVTPETVNDLLSAENV